MTGARVLYEGRVQGVGFRWTVKSLASEYDVCGGVRNLPDGRVELIAAGPDLEAFLQAVRNSHLAGHIRREHRETADLNPAPKGFVIWT